MKTYSSNRATSHNLMASEDCRPWRVITHHRQDNLADYCLVQICHAYELALLAYRRGLAALETGQVVGVELRDPSDRTLLDNQIAPSKPMDDGLMAALPGKYLWQESEERYKLAGYYSA